MRERKVAWILLRNATVVSLDGGVLTLRFARDGDVKGFTTSGCDADLKRVLSSRFGLNVTVKAVSANDPAAARDGRDGRARLNPVPAPPAASGSPAAPPSGSVGRDDGDWPGQRGAGQRRDSGDWGGRGEPRDAGDSGGRGGSPRGSSGGDAQGGTAPGRPTAMSAAGVTTATEAPGTPATPAGSAGPDAPGGPGSRSGNSGETGSGGPGGTGGTGPRGLSGPPDPGPDPGGQRSQPFGLGIADAIEVPDADDLASPGQAEISGMDLIQRELGGQIIGEIED